MTLDAEPLDSEPLNLGESRGAPTGRARLGRQPERRVCVNRAGVFLRCAAPIGYWLSPTDPAKKNPLRPEHGRRHLATVGERASQI